MALQVEKWNNEEKIIINKKEVGKQNELSPSQEYIVRLKFTSSKRAKWIFCLFRSNCILNYTCFHAFLFPSDAVTSKTPDFSKAERLDYKITLEGLAEDLQTSEELTIHSFVVYKKFCAIDFLYMIFKKFPKVRKISFPTSHRGLESAIRKTFFSYDKVAKTYVKYRPE